MVYDAMFGRRSTVWIYCTNGRKEASLAVAILFGRPLVTNRNSALIQYTRGFWARFGERARRNTLAKHMVVSFALMGFGMSRYNS